MKIINKLSIYLISTIMMVFLSTSLLAQKNKTVITIEDQNITDTEFLQMYNKNNVSDISLRTSLEDYLDLFINYKLKVLEARNLRYDTISKLQEELNGYRQQLAKPYLIDEEVNKELLHEAYQRMLYDVNASHILIKILPTAPAKDTVEAYKKAMKIRRELLEGKSFEELAVEFSEDPSAKDRMMNGRKIQGNKGHLGYFTVFDMVYPFETATYDLEVGEISKPIRSNFGYHIIKLNEKKKALGQVKIGHIMKIQNNMNPEKDTINAHDKITEIYNKLNNGEKFEDLAMKFSDDKATASGGGLLPLLKATRLLPEFVHQISNLKVGEYSPPFQTKFGWHIIKLIEHKGIGTFEEKKDDIKKQIAKSDRANKSVISLVKKIKKENKHKTYPDKALEIANVINDDLYSGTWKADTASHMKDVVFEIGDTSYSQFDFAKFIEQNPPTQKSKDLKTLLKIIFDSFVDTKVIAYHDAHLSDNFPEFKALMKEYEDGILLFELTNDKVWQKAIEDTIGLKNYYEENKDKYNWEQRAEAKIFILLNDEVTDKAMELANSISSKEELIKQLNDSTHTNVIIKEGKYEKDANDYIEKIAWKKGNSEIKNYKKQKYFVHIDGFVDPQPKTLKEARGMVTSDYQNYLEKRWIEDLRNKYDYHVNKKVFNKLKP